MHSENRAVRFGGHAVGLGEGQEEISTYLGVGAQVTDSVVRYIDLVSDWSNGFIPSEVRVGVVTLTGLYGRYDLGASASEVREFVAAAHGDLQRNGGVEDLHHPAGPGYTGFGSARPSGP